MALSQQIKDEEQVAKLIDRENWSVALKDKHTGFIHNGMDITQEVYTEQVDAFASTLAGWPLVRKALLPYQRDCFRENPGGLVAEGRDCGTVVFPSAGLKIYLTAKDDIRAERRAHQRGGSLPVDDVIALQKQRDERDTRRALSPLRPPEGAFIIDAGALSFDDMVQQAYEKSHKLFS